MNKIEWFSAGLNVGQKWHKVFFPLPLIFTIIFSWHGKLFVAGIEASVAPAESEAKADRRCLVRSSHQIELKEATILNIMKKRKE